MKISPNVVRTLSDVKRLRAALRGTVSFDIETTCLNPWQRRNAKGKWDPAAITLIGFGTKDAQWSIPCEVAGSPWTREQINDFLPDLIDALEDCFVVMQGGKFDCLWMYVHFGVWMRNDFDTMLAHYIVDENSRHGLKEIAPTLLGVPSWDIDLDTKQGKGSIDKLVEYHAYDLLYTRELRFKLGEMLNRDREVKGVFNKILMPLARMFVEVQYDGICVDMTKFDEAETYLRTEMDVALKELNKYGKINWGSPKQVGELLYGKLKIKCPQLTKKGKPSTAETVLNQLDHPCVGALIKYRGHKQQLSFFIDGWKPHLHKCSDGMYLHPSVKLHGTVTGRPSCENPNLYQVPRDPRIRQLVTAPEGWTFVEADLSQIELRLAADAAQEQVLLTAFREGKDPHWQTAIREIERGAGLAELVLDTARTWKQDKGLSYSEAIEILLEMGADEAIAINPAWKEYRKKAKAINFGYLYGMWWKKFKIYARDNYGVDVSDKDAQASREFFFDTYNFEPWHKRQRRFARSEGYVRSLSGRKRRLPDAMLPIWDHNVQDLRKRFQNSRRKEAERQAINSPIQSFANELCFMAALQMRKEFGRDKVRICGTVYDAILMRVKNEHVEEATERLLQIMSHPDMLDDLEVKLTVPIVAEAKCGPWGMGISFEKWKRLRRDKK